jgi:crossover junction endodeoxyribonuclease RuvC
MPGQGVASTFSFGVNYGKYQGALLSLGVPYSLVRPQEWQKGLGLPADKKTRKEAIAAKALAMYPNGGFYGARGGLLDGRSDAAMIANYCRKQFI